MSAPYKAERHRLHSEDGLKCLAETLTRIAEASANGGCCIAHKVMNADTFLFHNAIDWLSEHGYIEILSDTGRGQDMVLRPSERLRR